MKHFVRLRPSKAENEALPDIGARVAAEGLYVREDLRMRRERDLLVDSPGESVTTRCMRGFPRRGSQIPTRTLSECLGQGVAALRVMTAWSSGGGEVALLMKSASRSLVQV